MGQKNQLLFVLDWERITEIMLEMEFCQDILIRFVVHRALTIEYLSVSVKHVKDDLLLQVNSDKLVVREVT